MVIAYNAVPLECTSLPSSRFESFKRALFLHFGTTHTHITSAITAAAISNPTMTPMTIPIIAPTDTEHNK